MEVFKGESNFSQSSGVGRIGKSSTGGGTDIKCYSTFSVVPPLITFIELLYSYVFTLFGKILLHSCLVEFLKACRQIDLFRQVVLFQPKTISKVTNIKL